MTSTGPQQVYRGAVWRHATMVTHNGELLAFAVDENRRFFYAVLDSDKAAQGDDALAWPTEPRALPFPQELVQEGFAAVSADRVPSVRLGDGAEVDPGSLRDAERDAFRSST